MVKMQTINWDDHLLIANCNSRWVGSNGKKFENIPNFFELHDISNESSSKTLCS